MSKRPQRPAAEPITRTVSIVPIGDDSDVVARMLSTRPSTPITIVEGAAKPALKMVGSKGRKNAMTKRDMEVCAFYRGQANDGKRDAVKLTAERFNLSRKQVFNIRKKEADLGNQVGLMIAEFRLPKG